MLSFTHEWKYNLKLIKSVCYCSWTNNGRTLTFNIVIIYKIELAIESALIFFAKLSSQFCKRNIKIEEKITISSEEITTRIYFALKDNRWFI